MKKYFIIILVFILLLKFIKIPNYIELNDLKIIKSINVDCNNEIYYLKEIIPIKSSNGIKYKNKTYKLKYEDITNKYFLNDVKEFGSNCSNYKEIIKELNIKPKIIKNNND